MLLRSRDVGDGRQAYTPERDSASPVYAVRLAVLPSAISRCMFLEYNMFCFCLLWYVACCGM